jgi:hypothetical protein
MSNIKLINVMYFYFNRQAIVFTSNSFHQQLFIKNKGTKLRFFFETANFA